MTPANTTPTLIDRIFRDSNGNLVVAQPPNPPLLVWLSTAALQLLPLEGSLKLGVEAVSFGAAFTWAWTELFQGVNLFRRSLGLVVLVGVVASQL